MNKIGFKKFIDSTMREEIEKYFFSHSDLEFREHFNLSHANVRELKKLYNLHYSKEQISQKCFQKSKKFDIRIVLFH